MADMGRLIAEAEAYGREQYAEGAASRQADVDAVMERLGEVIDEREALRAEYDAHMQTHVVTPPPPDPEPEPEPEPAAKVIIGMSALPDSWAARLAEVGPEAIGARRIFCNLTATGRDKETLIRRAIADGMIPVLSYKGTPTTANTAALKAFLVSLNTTVAATFHHEPHGDMTPAEFRARSRVFLDGVKAPNVKVGPILNGWLLDNRVADWTSYTDAGLLRDWDFLGVDTYSEGTVAAPSTSLLCGRAIPKVRAWLKDQGHPDKPQLVGEFNGQTVAAINHAATQILADPHMWIACLWNVDHAISDKDPALKFNKLTGDRLQAFKTLKADKRVQK